MSSNLTTSPSGRLVAASRITRLEPHEIFVFGSNARGRHGSGAARVAHEAFGAVWGRGHGLQGQSYAIDTMSGPGVLASEIATFVAFATAHPGLTFLVAEIGCRKAGYTPAQVAPHFATAPANVALPASFVQVTASLATAPAVNRRPRAVPATELSAIQLDRAVGAIVASAAGDALGAPYEFGPAHADDFQPAFGTGVFGHEPGEWTDDTSMSLPILEAIARGDSLRDEGVLGGIVARWLDWSRTAKDIGNQTRSVLALLDDRPTALAARRAARLLHERTGRSAGNGSLMRTGPVALAYLRPGSEHRLVEAAGRIARLTHSDEVNADAAVLWSLMIRGAILTGRLDPWTGVSRLPTERQSRWATLIDEAVIPGRHPRDFREQNGSVVKAFQAALCAVSGATNVPEALARAIQGGGDTDTVAAIAGSLAGAMWGATQVPLAWQRALHGWPGYVASDLTRLGVLAARRGHTDRKGWPRGGDRGYPAGSGTPRPCGIPTIPGCGSAHRAPCRNCPTRSPPWSRSAGWEPTRSPTDWSPYGCGWSMPTARTPTSTGP